jgi:NAD(P)-dependent dehydrogenase (short-subunit alcohol dehydrogenase family)
VRETYQDKVALITGGASGIGRGLSEALARAGATVVIGDINAAGAEQVAASITAAGGRATAASIDVTAEESVRAFIGTAHEDHGRIDFLFNNAGVAVAGEAQDLNADHWRHVIDVNLWGVIYGTMHGYAIMTKQGHGHIVNTASLAGLAPFPTNLPYSASKFAVVGLSTSLRVEGRDLGVKVSVVCPGFIESNIYTASEVVNAPKEKIMNSIPFKKVRTEDAARKILEGVARNREIIIFPTYAKVIWWMSRLCRPSLNPGLNKSIRDFRRLRSDAK